MVDRVRIPDDPIERQEQRDKEIEDSKRWTLRIIWGATTLMTFGLVILAWQVLRAILE
jgi:hypothetical protein